MFAVEGANGAPSPLRATAVEILEPNAEWLMGTRCVSSTHTYDQSDYVTDTGPYMLSKI